MSICDDVCFCFCFCFCRCLWTTTARTKRRRKLDRWRDGASVCEYYVQVNPGGGIGTGDTRSGPQTANQQHEASPTDGSALLRHLPLPSLLSPTWSLVRSRRLFRRMEGPQVPRHLLRQSCVHAISTATHRCHLQLHVPYSTCLGRRSSDMIYILSQLRDADITPSSAVFLFCTPHLHLPPITYPIANSIPLTLQTSRNKRHLPDFGHASISPQVPPYPIHGNRQLDQHCPASYVPLCVPRRLSAPAKLFCAVIRRTCRAHLQLRSTLPFASTLRHVLNHNGEGRPVELAQLDGFGNSRSGMRGQMR